MPEFSEFEEEQIVLLALDSPDFFYRIVRFMKPEYFEADELQYIMHTYIEYYEKFDEVPTKEILKDIVYKDMKADEESSRPVMEILEKELDPRNSKYIRDQVVKWARIKQMSLIYDEEVMVQAQEGNWQAVDELIQQAAGISDVIIKPFRFFKDIDELFVEDTKEHFTTGFTRLDNAIHDGRGPARKEVLLWVAPTGVGKSLTLVNTSLVNVLQGKNVLHITLENSEKVTGHRYLGAFTNLPIAQRKRKVEEFKKRIKKIEMSTNADLFILYFPTDTISIREVEISIKELYRQYSFTPDMIVLDYLECLLSKNQYRNREDYDRQKSVSSELRALAAITNTFIASASQTNRAGSKSAEEGENINLDKIAESFGKAMPTDYVVSINQSKKDIGEGEESHMGNVRFFIAKNRNGPKYKTINAKINYATMKAVQEDMSND